MPEYSNYSSLDELTKDVAADRDEELEFLAKLVDLFESTPRDDAMTDRSLRYLTSRYAQD